MISSLVKALMAAKGLKQADLVEILGVPIDRVKSLTSGRVQKLSPEETRALVEKLHVSGDWLATGQGVMFQEPRVTQRLQTIKETTERAATLELPMERRVLVRDVLYGVAMDDVDFLNITIDGFLAMYGSQVPVPKRTRKPKD